MKKTVATIIMASILSSTLSADFLRIEMGGGVWQNDISGNLQYENMNLFSTDTLGYSDESRGYLWIFIKHPIPILPNIRLEYADVEFSGTSTEPFEYNGFTFGVGTNSVSRLKQYDAILYYNILDNTAYSTLDLGLDVKFMDTAFKVNGSATPINKFIGDIEVVNESEYLIIPLLYGRVRFEIAETGFGFEANAKYITYNDSSMLDYALKLDYTLRDLLPIDIGLEVGYRFENIDFQVDDFSSINTSIDVDVDGVFAGAVLRF